MPSWVVDNRFAYGSPLCAKSPTSCASQWREAAPNWQILHERRWRLSRPRTVQSDPRSSSQSAPKKQLPGLRTQSVPVSTTRSPSQTFPPPPECKAAEVTFSSSAPDDLLHSVEHVLVRLDELDVLHAGGAEDRCAEPPGCRPSRAPGEALRQLPLRQRTLYCTSRCSCGSTRSHRVVLTTNFEEEAWLETLRGARRDAADAAGAWHPRCNFSDVCRATAPRLLERLVALGTPGLVFLVRPSTLWGARRMRRL